MKSILAFGEILWDLLPDRTVLGGAVFNLGFRLQTLGNTVFLVSRVGADDLGRRALTQAAELGLSVDYIQIDPDHPTGTVPVRLKNGIPDFTITPDVAFDYIELNEELMNAAASADALVFGTLIQRACVSRATLRSLVEAAPQAVKFLDINLRKNCYTEETVRWSLQAADLLKLNDDEVGETARLLGLSSVTTIEFAQRMITDFAMQCVVVMLGEKGVYALSAAGNEVYEPGYRVQVVDTVGAGDACAAGFLHGWLNGESLAHACRLGNALGALVAATPGATEKILPQQIDALLGNGAERIIAPAFKHLIKEL
ncbi:MAG: PfkB family carbohydrate kinase [candidate division KSB1 bacterium]|nr:PfkB family carbohydrate kinase [candidate division KSB1 bacterium]